METESIFGKTIECECGRIHRITPREVIYSEDAVAQLPDVCASVTKGRSVSVLMDIRTREAVGAEAQATLSHAGWEATEVLVPDRPDGSSPVCDDLTKDSLAGSAASADLIVSVGSGVISDLGKWLGFEMHIPFVSFATASSMNGYTSANVAPTIGGVKTLIRARPPVVVIASPAVLRDAPYELTTAGLGDVLAKSTSSVDWYLNHLLFGDYYCERSVGLIAEIEPLYLEHPRRVHDRDPEAMEALFRALLLTGAAMTMAETSAPASGAEHLISHTLDMMSTLDGLPHDLHGRQVGVGTILAADVYRRVLAVESPHFVEPPDTIDSEFWGPLAPAVARQYREKLPRYDRAREKLKAHGAWDHLREQLQPMLRAGQTIRDCLGRAGGACTAQDFGIDRERLLTAMLLAHEMRSRFTVLDLAHLTGILPDSAPEIIRKCV